MALLMNQTTGQMFGGAGPNHAPGLVPDPGSVTAVSPFKFVRNDGAFAQIAFSDLSGNLSVNANSVIVGTSAGLLSGVAFGSVNQVLASTGPTTAPTWVNQTVVNIPALTFNVTVFQTPGTVTYTPSAGLAFAKVTTVGGGGAGGGAIQGAGGVLADSVGSGGGGGGIQFGMFSAASLGASVVIVIGSGGVGVAGTTGGTGGVTTFGTFMTCNGGVGGVIMTSSNQGNLDGGVGGTATGVGYLKIQGSTGNLAWGNQATSTPDRAGEGAPGFCGGGISPLVVPTNAVGFGAGGGGAAPTVTTGSTLAGLNGSAGVCIVEETIFH